MYSAIHENSRQRKKCGHQSIDIEKKLNDFVFFASRLVGMSFVASNSPITPKPPSFPSLLYTPNIRTQPTKILFDFFSPVGSCLLSRLVSLLLYVHTNLEPIPKSSPPPHRINLKTQSGVLLLMPAALPHAGLEVGALLGDVVEAEAVKAGLHLLLSLLLCWLCWLGWLMGV